MMLISVDSYGGGAEQKVGRGWMLIKERLLLWIIIILMVTPLPRQRILIWHGSWLRPASC